MISSQIVSPRAARVLGVTCRFSRPSHTPTACTEKGTTGEGVVCAAGVAEGTGVSSARSPPDENSKADTLKAIKDSRDIVRDRCFDSICKAVFISLRWCSERAILVRLG